jgi:hypothetical protein
MKPELSIIQTFPLIYIKSKAQVSKFGVDMYLIEMNFAASYCSMLLPVHYFIIYGKIW